MVEKDINFPFGLVYCVHLCNLPIRRRLYQYTYIYVCTGELGYDGPLNDGLLSMTDDMLGPSPMHIKYLPYVYDRFCI